jgi:hypothetical protein
MADVINTSTLNAELFKNFQAAAQYAAYEMSLARGVMDARTLAAGQGKVVSIPVWDAITAAIITDESAAEALGTDTNSVDITIAEIVAAHRVNDMLRDSAFENVIMQLADQSGMSVAEGMDSQAFALFNSLSTNSVGTEDSALTVDSIFEAVAKIRAAKYRGPLNAVVGIRGSLQLKKELAGTGGVNLTANETGNSVIRTGFIGTVAGVNIYESSLVKADLDTDADTELNEVGAVFAPGAFAQVMRGPITVEQDRQGLARATDIIVTANSGAGIVRDAFACKLVGSATD